MNQHTIKAITNQATAHPNGTFSRGYLIGEDAAGKGIWINISAPSETAVYKKGDTIEVIEVQNVQTQRGFSKFATQHKLISAAPAQQPYQKKWGGGFNKSGGGFNSKENQIGQKVGMVLKAATDILLHTKQEINEKNLCDTGMLLIAVSDKLTAHLTAKDATQGVPASQQAQGVMPQPVAQPGQTAPWEILEQQQQALGLQQQQVGGVQGFLDGIPG